jgi:hypothetical protein
MAWMMVWKRMRELDLAPAQGMDLALNPDLDLDLDPATRLAVDLNLEPRRDHS